jgi:ASCH domain
MNCLSLKQPYAELLVSGKKTIELRNWNTSFRGKFLVHASKNIDKKRLDFLGIDYNRLTLGAIIGSAVLYDVKQYRHKIELELDKNKHLVSMDS